MRIKDRSTPETNALMEREQRGCNVDIWGLAYELEQQRDHALEALRAIANPIAAMQKAVPKGHLFNGAMAVQIAADPAYYQGIAREALDEIERGEK